MAMEESNSPEDLGDSFFEVHIDNISVTDVGFILFLKGKDESRLLPIFIGANEAQSIAIALNQQESPRPMTHDLLKNMLEALDCSLTKVAITSIADNTFYARIHVRKGDIEEMDFDARPSDAMALALRWGVPIFIQKDVFLEASVPVPNEEGSEIKTEEKADVPNQPETFLTPMDKLLGALKKAIQEEAYEEAARIRDELKKMQSGN